MVFAPKWSATMPFKLSQWQPMKITWLQYSIFLLLWNRSMSLSKIMLREDAPSMIKNLKTHLRLSVDTCLMCSRKMTTVCFHRSASVFGTRSTQNVSSQMTVLKCLWFTHLRRNSIWDKGYASTRMMSLILVFSTKKSLLTLKIAHSCIPTSIIHFQRQQVRKQYLNSAKMITLFWLNKKIV